MDRIDLLDELKKLSKLKNNWYSVAAATEKLKVRTAENAYPARRLREASEVTSYSSNTLNRMISVKTFIDLAKSDVPEFDGIDPNILSFPSLEVVKRLYQANAEDGRAMLVKVAKGEVTYRELRKHYDAKMTETGSYSTGQVALREKRTFEEVALKYIENVSAELFETNVPIRFKKPSHSDLADIIVEPAEPSKTLFRFGVMFDTLNHPKMSDRFRFFMNKSIAFGNFFDKYWIIFPSNANPEIISGYIDILDLLEKNNYAVVLIPWEEQGLNTFEIKRSAIGDPNPDLRGREDRFKEIQSSIQIALKNS